MEPSVVDTNVARIFALLGEKLGARGRSLEARVAHARRELPRRVRHAAAELIRAEQMARDPKICLRLDPVAVRTAYTTCVEHLESIDVGARKSKARFDFAAAAILQLGVVAAATVGLLNWRGFL